MAGAVLWTGSLGSCLLSGNWPALGGVSLRASEAPDAGGLVMWQRLSRQGREKAGLQLCSQLSTCRPDPRPRHKRRLWGPEHALAAGAAACGPDHAESHSRTSRRGRQGLRTYRPQEPLSAAGIGGRATLLPRAVPAGRPLPSLRGRSQLRTRTRRAGVVPCKDSGRRRPQAARPPAEHGDQRRATEPSPAARRGRTRPRCARGTRRSL